MNYLKLACKTYGIVSTIAALIYFTLSTVVELGVMVAIYFVWVCVVITVFSTLAAFFTISKRKSD